MFARVFVALSVICVLTQSSFGQGNVSTNFPSEALLFEAKIDQCESEIAQLLEKDPENDNARFALGITRFVGSIETMGQSFYTWGLRSNSSLPFIRMPVDDNPDYEDVTYELFRETFAQLKEDLAEVERTLEPIKADNVKLRSHPFEFRLDLNDDGKGQRSETLKRIGARYFRGLSRMPTGPVVHFDKADVHWLRGYCHLLSAMCDFVLAYDQEPMWNVAARQIFRGAIVTDDFLMEEEIGDNNFWGVGLLDLIAAIHESDMKLIDAEKMKSARKHLLATIEQSRIMWDEIEKETDNEGEWIPGVGQMSLFPGVTFTREMVRTWRQFLDEGEKILNGEMLIPFWRGKKKTRGVNFKRFFTEPEDFDLVLWIHGTGAKPFLEEGEVSSPATWGRFQRVFRGDFIGFAMWVN